MPSISSLLNTGRNAMSTHKLAIAVTGNNIANAATPGYVRQRLDATTDISVRSARNTVLGTGVKAEAVKRSFDTFTYERIVKEDGKLGFYAAQQPELEALNAAYNEISSGGLGTSIGAFFAAINVVASNPEGAAEREVVLGAGETVARRFNELASALQSARIDLDERVQGSMDAINNAAGTIAVLNAKIATAEATGSDAGNLRSQREVLIRQIASEASTTIEETDTGSVTVRIGGRVLVQEETAYQLVGVPDPLNDGLRDVYLDDGSQLQNLTNVLTGGELGGALSLRDATIPEYQTALDELAYALATEFNVQHQAGYGLDGVTGRDFFDPPGAVAGAASSMALSASVVGDGDAFAASATPTGLPGDNQNAILLYQLSEQNLVGGATTFAQSAFLQGGQVGVDTKTAGDEVEFQTQLLNELEQVQESISGVSIDEEATNLLKYQNAYQAAGRFMTVVQEMMDTLMRI